MATGRKDRCSFTLSSPTTCWFKAFLADGNVSQEKLVWFAMSFMSKDAAAQWAKQCSSAILFPFPTWAQFEAEFCLRFVEENK
jgi:hypothetical protein